MAASAKVYISQVASGLTCTRQAFATCFLRAQVHLAAENRMLFEVLVTGTTDKECFEQALEHARLKGWYDELIKIIVNENLAKADLLIALSKEGDHAIPALQAISNLTRNFTDPHDDLLGVFNGIRWTGNVLIDGQPEGSGLLVGPHLFITAWHVVAKLFKREKDQVTPDESAAVRLSVKFDYFDATSRDGKRQIPMESRVVPAHEDWCVTYSRCHQDELTHNKPKNLHELDGYWDYAVIKLKSAIGLERRWAKLDPRAEVPAANEKITVFQYPKGAPLKYDSNILVDGEESQRSYIPRMRFLHEVNTLDGSSGGPCFDKRFTCFGLHQGVWDKDKPINKGIPIVRVLEEINRSIAELPSLQPEEFARWSFGPEGNHEPILACDEFQSLIWKSANVGRPKLVSITGAAGSGKTFRIRVLMKILDDGAHLKLQIDADVTSKMGVIAIANKICSLSGAELPSINPYENENSTVTVWLKDEVIPKVINTLDHVRKNKVVWLLFTGLNSFKYEGTHVNDFLNLLFERLIIVDWLRVVLDGHPEDLPDSLWTIREFYSIENIRETDIESFFAKFGVGFSEYDISSIITFLKAEIIHEYRGFTAKDPSTAMKNLKSLILKKMEVLFILINKNGKQIR